jgi:hypothetical protein
MENNFEVPCVHRNNLPSAQLEFDQLFILAYNWEGKEVEEMEEGRVFAMD